MIPLEKKNTLKKPSLVGIETFYAAPLSHVVKPPAAILIQYTNFPYTITLTEYIYFQRLTQPRSSSPEVFCKKRCSSKFCKNSQENTCARVYFFNKVADLRPVTLLRNRLWHRCFEFCEISENTFSYRTPPMAGCVKHLKFWWNNPNTYFD